GKHAGKRSRGLPEICPDTAAFAPEMTVICQEIAGFHAEKFRLCDDLEQIADSLPHKIDRELCRNVAARILPFLPECHTYEEAKAFPAFEAASTSPQIGAASVRRLIAEHIEDQCAAQDLADVLFPIGHGSPIDNPEALGFMLRAFFEGVRRHIAFEREH